MKWQSIASAPKGREILAYGTMAAYNEDIVGSDFVCWQPQEQRFRRTRAFIQADPLDGAGAAQ